MSKHRTTEDLRETLFDVIDRLKENKMETRVASGIVNAAKTIIDTAQLELNASLVSLRLESVKTGVHFGPLLLTKQSEGEGTK